MSGLRHILALFGIALLASAQDRPGVLPTAVYTLADHHTTRWAGDRDPLMRIYGVCQITPAQESHTLSCSGPPVSQARTGRRHYYSVVLFRDLNETLYLAACSAVSRESRCDDLKAGQTFSAEVEKQAIRIVISDEQLPLRILEKRPKPVTIDSPTQGTPSQVRPSAGAPSSIPYSRVSESRGTPSNVRPSDVSVAAGAPSAAPPSEVSSAVVSPTGARLYVYCSSGSARVYVDDQLIGNPPVDVPLLPGRHRVVVRAPGFRNWERRIDTPAGKSTRVTAELRQ